MAILCSGKGATVESGNDIFNRWQKWRRLAAAAAAVNRDILIDMFIFCSHTRASSRLRRSASPAGGYSEPVDI
jgi:hypothetical protein